MTLRYYFFWSGPFSQWHPCSINIGDNKYNCAEQYMMHQKAVIFDDTEVAEKILAATDPSKQKALGKKVENFDEDVWRNQRERIVHTANYAKFNQNKGLRRKLFQTGNALLVEASPLDAIWGIGLPEEKAKQMPPADWPGQNLLGKIITKVREELRLICPEEEKSISAFENLWSFKGALAQ